MHKVALSIIIPVFNEKESLEFLIFELLKNLEPKNLEYEVIFIDDGSTDQSASILKKIREANRRIKIIIFSRNFGKSAALSAGFKYAKGEYVVTMDADLQDDPNEIFKLIDKAEKDNLDLVSGWKFDRQDNIIKKISSKIFNYTLNKLTKINIHDYNCGFKLYRHEVIENLDIYGEMHRFLPVLAFYKGFTVGEMVVTHHSRKYGQSKYGQLGLKRINNYFLDILNILLLTKYFKKPLHFFGGPGLLLFFGGSIIEFYIFLLKIFNGTIDGHYPLLALGILLILVGLQLLSLGLIAELIINNNSKIDQRPYHIKEKIID